MYKKKKKQKQRKANCINNIIIYELIQNIPIILIQIIIAFNDNLYVVGNKGKDNALTKKKQVYYKHSTPPQYQ